MGRGATGAGLVGTTNLKELLGAYLGAERAFFSRLFILQADRFEMTNIFHDPSTSASTKKEQASQVALLSFEFPFTVAR